MTSDRLYQDSSEDTEARIDDLLSKMTIPEKVGQMVGMHVGSFVDTQREADDDDRTGR